MDRILDSGSNDWGSTPHGCTCVGGFEVAYLVDCEDVRWFVWQVVAVFFVS